MSEPLHRTVHWRRFKEIATLIFNIENIDRNLYDFDHIICYSATRQGHDWEKHMF